MISPLLTTPAAREAWDEIVSVARNDWPENEHASGEDILHAVVILARAQLASSRACQQLQDLTAETVRHRLLKSPAPARFAA